MSFNKHTWSGEFTAAKGLSRLAADDAKRKGFTPKSKTKEKQKKQQQKRD